MNTTQQDLELKSAKPRRQQYIAEDFFDGNAFNPNKLANAVMTSESFVTFRDSKETYVYYPKTGIYRRNGETFVSEIAHKLLGMRSRPSFVRQTVETVKFETYMDRDQFILPKNLIVVANGVLDIDSGMVLPFSPNLHALNALPVKYDHNADCLGIKKFLSEVVHPDDILVLQELAGYLLESGYEHHKAFMLYGEGRNGKTTLIGVFTGFLGIENIASVALQDFKQRFTAADLYEKRANICDDLSDKDVEQTGMFKKLTGESPVRGERKYQDAFEFVNEAKMIFAANKLPRSKDTTDAYFSRWIPIVFPNKFEEGKGDPHLKKKLTTPEELSGFLNWALEGLRRLRLNGGFSYSKSAREVREYLERLTDSVSAFVSDCTFTDPSNDLPKATVYAAYKKYCNEEGLVPVHYQVFCQRVLGKRSVSESRPSWDGIRVQSFRGLKLVAASSS